MVSGRPARPSLGLYRALLICAVVLFALTGLVAGTATADSHGGGAEFGVEGPDTVAPGDEVTLNVTLDTTDPAYAVSFDLRAAGGTVLAVEKGPFLGSSTLVLESGAGADGATFGATRAGVSDGVTGAGTVARVVVAVPEDADGPLSLSFADAEVADPNATQLATATEGRDIRLDSEPASSGDGSGTTGPVDDSDSSPASEASVSAAVADSEGDISVVADVALDASLSAVARDLRARGARGVHTFPDAHAVGVRIDAGDAEELAAAGGVTALRTAAEAAPDGPAHVVADSVGAGRASATLSTPPSVSRVSLSLPNASANAPVAPRRVVFDTTGANGTVTVALTGPPSDAPPFDGTAVGGFEIEHPDVSADNVSVRFETNASPNARLYRLENDSWNALPTEQVGRTADGAVYRAESPGLSVFLVGDGTPTGSAEDADAVTATNTTTESGPVPGFTVSFAVLALALGALAHRRTT